MVTQDSLDVKCYHYTNRIKRLSPDVFNLMLLWYIILPRLSSLVSEMTLEPSNQTLPPLLNSIPKILYWSRYWLWAEWV